MAEAFKLRTAALTTVNANVYVCPANTTAIVFANNHLDVSVSILEIT